jgi:hypothetical protein
LGSGRKWACLRGGTRKKISFAIACIVVLSALSIGAAAQNLTLAKANVPFAFSVHDTTYPAGTYQVRQIGQDLLRLENVTDGRGVTLFAPSTIRESAGMTLVFRQYEQGRFLSSIEDRKLGYVTSVPMSGGEREMQKMQKHATIVALQTTR